MHNIYLWVEIFTQNREFHLFFRVTSLEALGSICTKKKEACFDSAFAPRSPNIFDAAHGHE
jgi:hypothetical protein